MNLKGFTLIELLVVLALLAGLFFLSTTSITQLTYKNEQQVLVDKIRTIIQYARIQAITLGQPVYLSPLAAKKSDWSKGIMLTQHDKSGKEKLMYQWQWHYPHWRISWSGINSGNKIALSNNPVNAISNGKFNLLNLYTKQSVIIVLNKLGRVRVSK